MSVEGAGQQRADRFGTCRAWFVLAGDPCVESGKLVGRHPHSERCRVDCRTARPFSNVIN